MNYFPIPMIYGFGFWKQNKKKREKIMVKRTKLNQLIKFIYSFYWLSGNVWDVYNTIEYI